MKYYIAYGSNLNVHQMRFRCPGAKVVGTAELKDYELLFKGSKTGSYLTIEKKNGSVVPVAIWAVTENDEYALDRYEGYPTFYYKKNLTVRNIETEEDMEVFVYIMHEDRDIGIPSMGYYDTCNSGYNHFGFDKKILKRAYLKSISEVRNGR